jgi:hypothetical protein
MKKNLPLLSALLPSFIKIIQKVSLLILMASVSANNLISAPPAAPIKVLSNEWMPLLDPELTHWETWMGCPHKTVVGLPPGTPLSENGRSGTPLGLNNDPKNVFKMESESGEPVLHISGEIYGGLTTLNSFSNYHFRCQFKWGTLKWEPRPTQFRDNGILFHCTGLHGAFDKAWKRSVEFQVIERGIGDLFLLSGAGCETTLVLGPANPSNPSGRPFYDPNASTLSQSPSYVRGLPGNFEKPTGEWNTLDLYVVGRTAVFVVNGVVVNAIRNMTFNDSINKTKAPLSAGQIQLQSEGAEALYRKMEIRSLSEYPPEIQKIANFKPEELQ